MSIGERQLLRLNVILFFLFLDCAFASEVNPKFLKNKFGELSINAEKIIRFHCGHCHTPNLKTSNPKALKVFSFGDQPWYNRMDSRQLNKSAIMLKERQDLTDAELEENFLGRIETPRRPSNLEVNIYQKFVQKVERKKFNPLDL